MVNGDLIVRDHVRKEEESLHPKVTLDQLQGKEGIGETLDHAPYVGNVIFDREGENNDVIDEHQAELAHACQQMTDHALEVRAHVLDAIDGTGEHEVFTPMHERRDLTIIGGDGQPRVGIFNIQGREDDGARQRSKDVLDEWQGEVIIRQLGVEGTRIEADATHLRIHLTGVRILLRGSRQWVVELAPWRSRHHHMLGPPPVDLLVHQRLVHFWDAVLAHELGFLNRDWQPDFSIGNGTNRVLWDRSIAIQ